MPPVQGLPPGKQVAQHTEAQKGAMMNGRRAKPKPSRAIAAAAASNPYAAQAQAEIDPIIAAIKAAAMGQLKPEDKAIEGLTNSYAQGIAGINYGAPYSSAEAQQAAVDAALQQGASGQGSDLAAALSQRLQALQGSSGANAVNQEAAALTHQGAGIGGAELATGSAALNQLIADAAAAKSYGQKMPGIVRDAGLQGIEQAQGQAEQAINQGTLQAESQLPSIEQTIKADKLQAQQNAATAAYHNAELSLSAQRNAISQQRANISASQGAQRLAIEQQNANTSALRAYQSNKQAWARIGIEKQRAAIAAAKSQAKLNSGGFTPSEIQHLDVTAATIARTAFGGAAAVGKPGEVHYQPALKPLNYKQAMLEMQKEGIPPSVAIKELALAGYKPGVRGAPLQAPQRMAKFFTQIGGSPLTTNIINNPQAQGILNLAKEYLGTPYVWGGESPKGFDCSGFAQYIYGKVGINIPRTTYTQWTASNGHAVAKNALRPGDLVFFRGSDSKGGLPGHVGIYIGNGQMIDAPHTGSDVRVESVWNFGGYMGARRFK